MKTEKVIDKIESIPVKFFVVVFVCMALLFFFGRHAQAADTELTKIDKVIADAKKQKMKIMEKAAREQQHIIDRERNVMEAIVAQEKLKVAEMQREKMTHRPYIEIQCVDTYSMIVSWTKTQMDVKQLMSPGRGPGRCGKEKYNE